MKFTNGMWLDKLGCTIEYPKEVFEGIIEDGSLVVYAPYTAIQHRGNVTDGGLLRIKICSPIPDVLRVTVTNWVGSRQRRAEFQTAPGKGAGQAAETETHYTFQSGGTEARIPKEGPFEIAFFFGGKMRTVSGRKSLAHILDPEGHSYVRERLDIAVGESVYGLGERFTAFVKNGQSLDSWNEDGGTETEQAYKCVPFYLTSANYGIFVNDTGRVSFEVASEAVNKVQFSVPGERLEYYFIGGADRKSVLSNYAELTGKPSLPPAWSFGLWLTTSFTTDYSEETVMHFVDGMLDRGIPLSVFHFDCYWMKPFEWTSFLFDRDSFPDPAGLIRRLHDKGVRVCVWINPYIAQKSPLFREGMDNNYFVNTGAGDVWQWDRWQAGMALVDFTNPVAKAWYQRQLENLIRMGVDCFKTDFGERIPVGGDAFYGRSAKSEGIVYASGVSSESMHNYYSYLYNQAVFEILEKRLGVGRAVLFSRAGTAGSQKFPVHWGGDSLSEYSSMAASLRAGLSLSLSGFGFWSHDIGGFEAGCTPDIYMRWTQFGLLTSHSRYHGNKEYKVPWLYGEEAVDVARLFTRLKLRLMPYLYAAAVEASASGIPVLRPMLLEFPDDETCLHLDRQYMLGESLLCAPIFSEDGIVRYYLPKGRWTNLLNREVITGPVWRTEHHDYDSMPLLVRDNTVLITGKTDGTPEYDYLDSVTATVYEISDQTEIRAEAYAAGSLVSGEIRVRRDGDCVVVRTEGFTGNCRLLLADTFRFTSCSDQIPEITDCGLLVELRYGLTEIVL